MSKKRLSSESESSEVQFIINQVQGGYKSKKNSERKEETNEALAIDFLRSFKNKMGPINTRVVKSFSGGHAQLAAFFVETEFSLASYEDLIKNHNKPKIGKIYLKYQSVQNASGTFEYTVRGPKGEYFTGSLSCKTVLEIGTTDEEKKYLSGSIFSNEKSINLSKLSEEKLSKIKDKITKNNHIVEQKDNNAYAYNPPIYPSKERSKNFRKQHKRNKVSRYKLYSDENFIKNKVLAYVKTRLSVDEYDHDYLTSKNFKKWQDMGDFIAAAKMKKHGLGELVDDISNSLTTPYKFWTKEKNKDLSTQLMKKIISVFRGAKEQEKFGSFLYTDDMLPKNEYEQMKRFAAFFGYIGKSKESNKKDIPLDLLHKIALRDDNNENAMLKSDLFVTIYKLCLLRHGYYQKIHFTAFFSGEYIKKALKISELNLGKNGDFDHAYNLAELARNKSGYYLSDLLEIMMIEDPILREIGLLQQYYAFNLPSKAAYNKKRKAIADELKNKIKNQIIDKCNETRGDHFLNLPKVTAETFDEIFDSETLEALLTLKDPKSFQKQLLKKIAIMRLEWHLRLENCKDERLYTVPDKLQPSENVGDTNYDKLEQPPELSLEDLNALLTVDGQINNELVEYVLNHSYRNQGIGRRIAKLYEGKRKNVSGTGERKIVKLFDTSDKESDKESDKKDKSIESALILNQATLQRFYDRKKFSDLSDGNAVPKIEEKEIERTTENTQESINFSDENVEQQNIEEKNIEEVKEIIKKEDENQEENKLDFNKNFREISEDLKKCYDRHELQLLASKQLEFKLHGCNLFLVSENDFQAKNISKISTKKCLYLFKSDDNKFYYYINGVSEKDKEYLPENNENIKSLKKEYFNTKNKKFKSCKDADICRAVLDVTSRRGHTDAYGILERISNLRGDDGDNLLLGNVKGEIPKDKVSDCKKLLTNAYNSLRFVDKFREDHPFRFKFATGKAFNAADVYGTNGTNGNQYQEEIKTTLRSQDLIESAGQHRLIGDPALVELFRFMHYQFAPRSDITKERADIITELRATFEELMQSCDGTLEGTRLALRKFMDAIHVYFHYFQEEIAKSEEYVERNCHKIFDMPMYEHIKRQKAILTDFKKKINRSMIALDFEVQIFNQNKNEYGRKKKEEEDRKYKILFAMNDADREYYLNKQRLFLKNLRANSKKRISVSAKAKAMGVAVNEGFIPAGMTAAGITGAVTLGTVALIGFIFLSALLVNAILLFGATAYAMRKIFIDVPEFDGMTPAEISKIKSQRAFSLVVSSVGGGIFGVLGMTSGMQLVVQMFAAKTTALAVMGGGTKMVSTVAAFLAGKAGIVSLLGIAGSAFAIAIPGLIGLLASIVLTYLFYEAINSSIEKGIFKDIRDTLKYHFQKRPEETWARCIGRGIFNAIYFLVIGGVLSSLCWLVAYGTGSLKMITAFHFFLKTVPNWISGVSLATVGVGMIGNGYFYTKSIFSKLGSIKFKILSLFDKIDAHFENIKNKKAQLHAEYDRQQQELSSNKDQKTLDKTFVQSVQQSWNNYKRSILVHLAAVHRARRELLKEYGIDKAGSFLALFNIAMYLVVVVAALFNGKGQGDAAAVHLSSLTEWAKNGSGQWYDTGIQIHGTNPFTNINAGAFYNHILPFPNISTPSHSILSIFLPMGKNLNEFFAGFAMLFGSYSGNTLASDAFFDYAKTKQYLDICNKFPEIEISIANKFDKKATLKQNTCRLLWVKNENVKQGCWYLSSGNLFAGKSNFLNLFTKYMDAYSGELTNTDNNLHENFLNFLTNNLPTADDVNVYKQFFKNLVAAAAKDLTTLERQKNSICTLSTKFNRVQANAMLTIASKKWTRKDKHSRMLDQINVTGEMFKNTAAIFGTCPLDEEQINLPMDQKTENTISTAHSKDDKGKEEVEDDGEYNRNNITPQNNTQDIGITEKDQELKKYQVNPKVFTFLVTARGANHSPGNITSTDARIAMLPNPEVILPKPISTK